MYEYLKTLMVFVKGRNAKHHHVFTLMNYRNLLKVLTSL